MCRDKMGASILLYHGAKYSRHCRFSSLHSRLGTVPHGWDETKDGEEGDLLSVGLALVYLFFYPYTIFLFLFLLYLEIVLYMLVVLLMAFLSHSLLMLTHAKYPWFIHDDGRRTVFLLAGWLTDFAMTATHCTSVLWGRATARHE